MRRRALLATAATLPTASAGCLSGGLPHDALVRAVQASVPEDADAVAGDDLGPGERDIARVAVEEPFYHACPDLPAALHEFAGRFSPDREYLRFRGTEYAMYVRIEDVVYASAASPPDEQPSCGLF